MWLWFAAPFLVGFFISGADISNILFWIQFIALGPFYCLVVYGVNDVYDFETDQENERKGEGASQGDILMPENHDLVIKTSLIFSALLLAISLFTRNIVNIAGMIFLIFWAFAYSAPPIRLKERPVVDSISNGFGYVLVPSMMGFSLGAPITAFPESGFWAALVISGMHAAFAVMDFEPDKAAGVNTIAVRFGKKATIMFPAVAVLMALIFSPLQDLISRILLIELFALIVAMALDIYGY